MALSQGDLSEDEEKEKDVYAAWSDADRSSFIRDVAEAEVAHTAEKKPEKLMLAGLVSVMDHLPAEVLKHHNLDTVLATLKGMHKSPRKEGQGPGNLSLIENHCAGLRGRSSWSPR